MLFARTYLLPLTMLLAVALPGRAQVRVELQEGSLFQIEGTSTVNAFTCTADSMDGYGIVSATSARQVNDTNTSKAEVMVPVDSLDCGKERMNNDMYEALRAAEYPVIRYVLDRAAVEARRSDDTYQLRATGRLTIAGTERTITTILTGERLAEGRYRLTGWHALRMTDFGVQPPTALLGLVRAHDAITVTFDLIAEAEALSVTH